MVIYAITEKQTMEFNINARVNFRKNVRAKMGQAAVRTHHRSLAHKHSGIWEAMEKLNELVDDSDPDVRILTPQIRICTVTYWCLADRRLAN